MKTVKVFFWSLILLSLASCAAIPKAPSTDNVEAKQLQPSTNVALVYIMRPSNLAFAISMDLSCNDKFIGSTGAKQFVYSMLSPGNYTFTSHAENKYDLPLKIEGGKTYYLQQKVKMGWMSARTALARLDEQRGRMTLNKCSLSSKNQPYQE